MKKTPAHRVTQSVGRDQRAAPWLVGEGLLSQEVHILPLQGRDKPKEEVECSGVSEHSSQGRGLSSMAPGLCLQVWEWFAHICLDS